jgi:hypothetical protein
MKTVRVVAQLDLTEGHKGTKTKAFEQELTEETEVRLTRNFVPKGMSERSLAVYCQDDAKKAFVS